MTGEDRVLVECRWSLSYLRSELAANGVTKEKSAVDHRQEAMR